MALSKKISSIYIRQNTGTPWVYTFVPGNFDSDLGQVNFTGTPFDEAINGFLRSNIRGYRIRISLNWEALVGSTISGNTEASGNTAGSFLDDMIASLVTSLEGHIQASLDNTNWHNVIPEDSSYGTSYRHQIGRGNFRITLIGQNILTTIPESLEAP